MTENDRRQGSCLCGAVRITVPARVHSVGACHCHMCRKWAGGPLMAMACGTDVVLEGEQNISLYDSSQWAERAFCRTCGSHLFYRLKDSGEHIVAPGLFDDAQGLVFDHQVFIDEKPGYYAFAGVTRELTGAEVFALFPEGKD